MGMSMHVVAFRPADETWKQMKIIYDACSKADISIPKEVDTFFDFEPPNEEGVQVEIERTSAVSEIREDMKDGFLVDLSLLPKDIKYIKFYNSY